jgi:hypothetical protein
MFLKGSVCFPADRHRECWLCWPTAVSWVTDSTCTTCHNSKSLHFAHRVYAGRDSSVGIATRYGLDGPGIESRGRRAFPQPSRPALGPPSLLYNGYQVFPGGKAAGAWRWPPTPCSAEVKERVELYLYSPFGLVLERTLPLPQCIYVFRLILTVQCDYFAAHKQLPMMQKFHRVDRCLKRQTKCAIRYLTVLSYSRLIHAALIFSEIKVPIHNRISPFSYGTINTLISVREIRPASAYTSHKESSLHGHDSFKMLISLALTLHFPVKYFRIKYLLYIYIYIYIYSSQGR